MLSVRFSSLANKICLYVKDNYHILLAVFVELDVVFLIMALHKSNTGVFRDDVCCFSDGLFVAIV